MTLNIEGLKKGMVIEPGYKLISGFEQTANGAFAFALKSGNEYFVKAFLSPKYPKPGLKISARVKKKKERACSEFTKNCIGIIAAFSKNLDPKKGQLIFPLDFRQGGSTYFQFTPKIDIAHREPYIVAGYSVDIKLALLKSLVNAISLIHMHDIVHGDIKFDNVLIKKTKSGFLVAKIIDFDGSYFSKTPHRIELMHSDQLYQAPELTYYSQENPHITKSDMTTKADIFSLGILMHEYCTGERPRVKNKALGEIYLGGAVNSDEEIILQNETIGPELSKIIKATLQKDYRLRPSAVDILNELNNAHIELHNISHTSKPKVETITSPIHKTRSTSKYKSTTEISISNFKIVSKKRK